MQRALGTVGLAPHRVRPIHGGWASWTFALDEQLIVRFPRTDEVAESSRRELALLPELDVHLSFQVPNPSHVGTWNERPFFAYRMIVGRGIEAADGSPALLHQLRDALAELHAFPVDRAAELLDAGHPATAWRRHYEQLWPIVEEHALPVVAPPLSTRIGTAYAAFLDQIDDLPACLIHNDLGVEHLLVDERATELVGIIDFEDAAVGDPAIDYVPLWATFGPKALEHLLPADGLGDRLEQRLHFYRWMGSVHAIVYGVTRGVPAEVDHGLRELTRRFDAHMSN